MKKGKGFSDLGGMMVGATAAAFVMVLFFGVHPRSTPDAGWAEPSDIPPIEAQNERIQTIEGKLPGQAHAMMDVSYHFSNLWFAAQKENWPLADFYLRETKSHLRWAVRIIPIRKDAQGEDVDLQGILQSIENTQLTWMEEAVVNQDKSRFEEAYRLTVEACYACHKASGKPYLRPKLPDHPPERMIEFSPEAEWPK